MGSGRTAVYVIVRGMGCGGGKHVPPSEDYFRRVEQHEDPVDGSSKYLEEEQDRDNGVPKKVGAQRTTNEDRSRSTSRARQHQGHRGEQDADLQGGSGGGTSLVGITRVSPHGAASTAAPHSRKRGRERKASRRSSSEESGGDEDGARPSFANSLGRESDDDDAHAVSAAHLRPRQIALDESSDDVSEIFPNDVSVSRDTRDLLVNWLRWAANQRRLKMEQRYKQMQNDARFNRAARPAYIEDQPTPPATPRAKRKKKHKDPVLDTGSTGPNDNVGGSSAVSSPVGSGASPCGRQSQNRSSALDEMRRTSTSAARSSATPGSAGFLGEAREARERAMDTQGTRLKLGRAMPDQNIAHTANASETPGFGMDTPGFGPGTPGFPGGSAIGSAQGSRSVSVVGSAISASPLPVLSPWLANAIPGDRGTSLEAVVEGEEELEASSAEDMIIGEGQLIVQLGEVAAATEPRSVDAHRDQASINGDEKAKQQIDEAYQQTGGGTASARSSVAGFGNATTAGAGTPVTAVASSRADSKRSSTRVSGVQIGDMTLTDGSLFVEAVAAKSVNPDADSGATTAAEASGATVTASSPEQDELQLAVSPENSPSHQSGASPITAAAMVRQGGDAIGARSPSGDDAKGNNAPGEAGLCRSSPSSASTVSPRASRTQPPWDPDPSDLYKWNESVFYWSATRDRWMPARVKQKIDSEVYVLDKNNRNCLSHVWVGEILSAKDLNKDRVLSLLHTVLGRGGAVVRGDFSSDSSSDDGDGRSRGPPGGTPRPLMSSPGRFTDEDSSDESDNE
ncbi:unnamed protein product [Amoebophrya sp. A25]|nr:unnamed protein product [Amoebophrya sp. A25]|eukprot:GSA25T00002366001.1